MYEILNEDKYNDTYGRYRMFAALKLKHQDDPDFHIPGERTIYRIMEAVGLVHRPKRNPKGITKADKNARKSDDKLKRNFRSERPLEKCVTDITEIKGSDDKLYVSAIFDCFDVTVLGLAMDTNMKAPLCVATLDNAFTTHPSMRGCICHSDRGTQYTRQLYRDKINELGIIQSMNSDGGRCHDNARCESMWARLKDELFYSRNLKSTDFTVAQLKTMIWRYFMSYWNNRRVCSSNDGLPPRVKRDRYYAALAMVEQPSALYELNLSTIIDNIIKWGDDADGTLTAMFSENYYTEQMLVTVDELYEKLSKKKISQVNFKKLNDEQLANYYVHLMESGTEESPDEKLQIQIEMVDRFVEKFADKKVDEILNNRKNMHII